MRSEKTYNQVITSMLLYAGKIYDKLGIRKLFIGCSIMLLARKYH